VRTGLLGVSAALTVGAFAVTGGLIPGQGGHYTVGTADGPADGRVTGQPGALATRSAAPATPLPATGSASPSDGPGPGSAPRASRSAERGAPGAKATTHSPTPSPSGTSGTDAGTPRSAPATPAGTSGDGHDSSPAAAAEAQVLSLVNDERAQAGCRPLDADPALADLAGDYSDEMAREGFFSHTTPDGLSPWDRAEAAGVSGLGGENIARGQQDARAVMDAWMHSPGHRANILNCDFTELGVGVHFGPGGPWWTQDFGY
jgi:uncharacterized protein YkwD